MTPQSMHVPMPPHPNPLQPGDPAQPVVPPEVPPQEPPTIPPPQEAPTIPPNEPPTRPPGGPDPVQPEIDLPPAQDPLGQRI